MIQRGALEHQCGDRYLIAAERRVNGDGSIRVDVNPNVLRSVSLPAETAICRAKTARVRQRIHDGKQTVVSPIEVDEVQFVLIIEVKELFPIG